MNDAKFIRDGYGVYVWRKDAVTVHDGVMTFEPEFYTRYFPTEQEAQEFAILERLAGKTARVVTDIPLVRKP